MRHQYHKDYNKYFHMAMVSKPYGAVRRTDLPVTTDTLDYVPSFPSLNVLPVHILQDFNKSDELVSTLELSAKLYLSSASTIY